MKGPNLRDTKPYTAVKGLDLGRPSKALLSLHQVGKLFTVVSGIQVSIPDSQLQTLFGSTLSIKGVRDVSKLGLREDKSLLARATVAKGWEAVSIHDKDKVADEI